MKVYIAASSREVGRVRAAQQAIAGRGWMLTLDWLTPMLANLERGIRDTDLSPKVQAEHALDDLAAVGYSDALWLLAPTELTKGAWVELGYAMGVSVPVVVSGACSSIFCHAADRIVATDAEALDAIVEVCG